MDGPKWQQADSIIGVNPGVGLRPRNTDARIDSQMFVLEQGDTNTHMSEHEGEGDLNADYVARAEKFLEVYADKDMGELGECNKGNHYGFVAKKEGDKVEPCIFIKL